MDILTFDGNNLSPVYPLDGEVKIVTKGLEAGGFVQVREEEPGGTYGDAFDKEGNLLRLQHPQKSLPFWFKGNYMFLRSSASISVGKEE